MAGSNLFAPVICGFINDSMGYGWVFYFPAIFCAATWIFLFIFMEETNYDRATVGVVATAAPTGSQLVVPNREEKGAEGRDLGPTIEPPGTPAPPPRKPKGFLKRMAIIDKPRPFMMHYRVWQSLKLLSWPVVFYSGFSYGTYLIYFNILNATSSIMLGGPPYNFRPAMVGLAYISCVIGVTAGYVSSCLTPVFVRSRTKSGLCLGRRLPVCSPTTSSFA